MHPGAEAAGGDYLRRVRSFAAAGIVLAGALAIAGSALVWVAIAEEPALVPGYDFGEQEVEAPRVSRPFTGLEAEDGWWTAASGAVAAAAGLALAVTARRGWAWIAFLSSVVTGAIVFADYRGIGDLSSSISQRLNVVGGAEPGIGITIVAAAAVLGLVASVAGLAATPSAGRDADVAPG